MSMKSKPIELYHVVDLIKELRLSDDEEEVSTAFTEAAIELMEPVGMQATTPFTMEPRYFTMRTVFKALNTNVLAH